MRCFLYCASNQNLLQPYGDVTTQFIQERPSLKVKEHRIINEEDLELEPLCKEVFIFSLTL